MHIGVTCSGELGAWRIVLMDEKHTLCDLTLDREEMQGLIRECLVTGKVLRPRTRAEYMGAVIAALHELDDRVCVRVDKGSCLD